MRTKHAAGFTLVELLVVIGIIAVLMSILMPAMAGVRNQGNEVKCMSNMRQMAAGIIMYANDNKGRYPWHVTLRLDMTQHAGYTKKEGFYDKLRKRYITDGWLTVCPFYAAKDSTLKDPYYYTATTGAWDWDKFVAPGTAQPTIINTAYAFTPNIQVAEDSKATPMTFLDPEPVGTEKKWPKGLHEASSQAAVIFHVLMYSDKSTVDNGHGAKPPLVGTGGTLPTSYRNLRTRSQPVAYGDGHVELHRNGDIQHRMTLRGKNWGDEEIWY
ncbi:MAG: type II secretion system protein [Tepidisphaeraceae bacterium]